MRLSIKVALICAISAAVPLIVSSVIITRSASVSVRDAAIKKLRSESNAGVTIYEKRLLEMRYAAQALADGIGVNALLDGSGPAGGGPARAHLQDLLTHARDDFSLDFLIVTDPAGNVIARHNDVPAPGETIATLDKGDPIAQRILEGGSRSQVLPLTAGVIENRDFLSKMWMDNAAKVSGSNLNQALVVEAGSPIFTAGRFSGVLLVGQMLNNYFVVRPGGSSIQTPLVTEIREKFLADNEGSGGLVALGNTVVASSVLGSTGGEPLLKGITCHPDQPFESVTGNGVEYEVAWEPIKVVNIGGSVEKAAAIGVAVPAAQLFQGNSTVVKTVSTALALDLLFAGVAGLLFGGTVSKRLRFLTEAVRRMSVGDLGTSISSNESKSGAGWGEKGSGTNGAGSTDEIGSLAETLDQMRESFRQAIERQRKR